MWDERAHPSYATAADQTGVDLAVADDVSDQMRLMLNTPADLPADYGGLRPGVPLGMPSAVIPAAGFVWIRIPLNARRITIANATAAQITRSYIGDANAGSWPIGAASAGGVPGTQSDDVSSDRVCIWGVAGTQINGPVAAQIVVEAYT